MRQWIGRNLGAMAALLLWIAIKMLRIGINMANQTRHSDAKVLMGFCAQVRDSHGEG